MGAKEGEIECRVPEEEGIEASLCDTFPKSEPMGSDLKYLQNEVSRLLSIIRVFLSILFEFLC